MLYHTRSIGSQSLSYKTIPRPIIFMANAVSIEQFNPFYLDQLPEDAPQTIQCMHDVPAVDRNIPPARLQTAGSILGLGYDVAFMRAAMGQDLEFVPIVADRLEGTLSVNGITSFLHARGCGGETAMPDVARLIAGRHPDELLSGVAGLGLNLSEDVVLQGHRTFVRNAQDSQLFVPEQRIAAAYIEGGRTPVDRIDVDGEHLAEHVLVDHTGKPFNTRDAWDTGHPAYNIGFGAMPGVAVEAMGGDTSLVNDQLLLGISALRHLVTAEAVLHHPDPGQELQFLIHS